MLIERFLIGLRLVVAGGKGDKLRVWECVGNGRCNGFGVKVIARAGHDESRSGDGVEVCEGVAWLGIPHAREDGVVGTLVDGGDGVGNGRVGGEEGLEFGEGFEVGLGHFSGIGDEFEVGGAGGREPGGAKEDEFFKALRVAEGEVEGDAGAHGEAAEVALFDAEVIHQGDDVVGEGVEGEGVGIEGHRLAVAGHVGRDQMGVFEMGESGSGLRFTRAESVEEDEGFQSGGAEGGVGEEHGE